MYSLLINRQVILHIVTVARAEHFCNLEGHKCPEVFGILPRCVLFPCPLPVIAVLLSGDAVDTGVGQHNSNEPAPFRKARCVGEGPNVNVAMP